MNTFQYWFVMRAPSPGAPHLSSFRDGRQPRRNPYVLYPEQLMRDRHTGTNSKPGYFAREMVNYWNDVCPQRAIRYRDALLLLWPQLGSGQLMPTGFTGARRSLRSEFSDYHPAVLGQPTTVPVN